MGRIPYRAFGRAIVLYDGLSFFFRQERVVVFQTRFTHIFSSSSSKKKQNPARPRQRAPARKGYKIWTEPEKDALTAGVKKYGPGATRNTTTNVVVLFLLSLKGNKPTSFTAGGGALHFSGASLSLSLSRRRRPLNRMFQIGTLFSPGTRKS